MSDRVEALGGVLSIVSAPGRGTTVIASLPLPSTDEPAAQQPEGGLDPHSVAALTPE
jgi:signal transduction histidine kinase